MVSLLAVVFILSTKTPVSRPLLCLCMSTKVLENSKLGLMNNSLSLSLERFGELTSTELLRKVNLLPKTSKLQHLSNQRDSIASTNTLRASITENELQETAVEKLAYRFNQVREVARTISKFFSHNCHMIDSLPCIVKCHVTKLSKSMVSHDCHCHSEVSHD